MSEDFATILKERDAALAEVARWEERYRSELTAAEIEQLRSDAVVTASAFSELIKEASKVQAERDAARADVERLTPVVDAARAFEADDERYMSAPDGIDPERERLIVMLLAAVKRFNANDPPERFFATLEDRNALRAEVERLRGLFPADCTDIPLFVRGLQDENAKLRERVSAQNDVIEHYRAEVERLRAAIRELHLRIAQTRFRVERDDGWDVFDLCGVRIASVSDESAAVLRECAKEKE